MNDYEKMLEHCKRLDVTIKRNIERREKARQTINKAYKVFTKVFEKEFVIAFDTLQEVQNFLVWKTVELWNECNADNELLGYVPQCNVSSYEEAKERTRKFYIVEKDNKKIKVA